MNNSLQIFDFGTHPVRVLERAGQPWFVAADVCRVLEIANSRDAISALDEDEKADVGITDISSSGVSQGRRVSAISESGLYALIFKSRKETARAFRKWVTGEVLPALRSVGHYEVTMPSDDEEVRRIVLVTLRGLCLGRLGVAHASAVFTGAKVYFTVPREASKGTLGDGRRENVSMLLQEVASELEETSSFPVWRLVDCARKRGLCDLKKLDDRAAAMDLGRQLANLQGRVLTDERGRDFQVNARRTRHARLYEIYFLGSAKGGAA